jgi:hypothetical protein
MKLEISGQIVMAVFEENRSPGLNLLGCRKQFFHRFNSDHLSFGRCEGRCFRKPTEIRKFCSRRRTGRKQH